MNLHTCLLTENDCYKAGRTIVPKGVMVHSTGANNPNLSRYVAPNDGLLGTPSSRHWNQSGTGACVHAFIGRLADGFIPFRSGKEAYLGAIGIHEVYRAVGADLYALSGVREDYVVDTGAVSLLLRGIVISDARWDRRKIRHRLLRDRRLILGVYHPEHTSCCYKGNKDETDDKDVTERILAADLLYLRERLLLRQLTPS